MHAYSSTSRTVAVRSPPCTTPRPSRFEQPTSPCATCAIFRQITAVVASQPPPLCVCSLSSLENLCARIGPIAVRELLYIKRGGTISQLPSFLLMQASARFFLVHCICARVQPRVCSQPCEATRRNSSALRSTAVWCHGRFGRPACYLSFLYSIVGMVWRSVAAVWRLWLGDVKTNPFAHTKRTSKQWHQFLSYARKTGLAVVFGARDRAHGWGFIKPSLGGGKSWELNKRHAAVRLANPLSCCLTSPVAENTVLIPRSLLPGSDRVWVMGFLFTGW